MSNWKFKENLGLIIVKKIINVGLIADLVSKRTSLHHTTFKAKSNIRKKRLSGLVQQRFSAGLARNLLLC